MEGSTLKPSNSGLTPRMYCEIATIFQAAVPVSKDRQIRMDRAEGKSTPESQLDQYGFAKDAGELKGEYETVLDKVEKSFNIAEKDICLGSTIFCTKPGDGSAREQAASCQKVLGAWANIAGEYATKRYRSNLINWGMLPFLYDGQEIHKGDYVFVPDVRKALIDKTDAIKAYVFSSNGNGGFGDAKEVVFSLGSLSDDERQINQKPKQENTIISETNKLSETFTRIDNRTSLRGVVPCCHSERSEESKEVWNICLRSDSKTDPTASYIPKPCLQMNTPRKP